ncbi:MAG: hypothetical protein KGI49_01205 [Patescibacteria group bacterium]|nr:hypothetical protein [Patescibacteria group bacterium]
MKRHYIIAITALVLSAILPLAASAQEDSADQEQQQLPPPMIQRFQAGLNRGIEDAANNRDYRNRALEDSLGSSSEQDRPDTYDHASGTPPFPLRGEGESRDHGMMTRYGYSASGTPMMWWQASTSPFFNRAREHGSSTAPFPPFMTDFGSSTPDVSGHENWPSVRLDMFAFMQNNLVDRLSRALDNLVQIRGRIADRIQAEASTTDMSAAENLLTIADQKLTAARSDIQALASYVPMATSTQGLTASTTVGLGIPRQIGSQTIQAVSDARRALNDVVVSIAHSMGIDIGNNDNASSTNTSSSTQDR